MSRVHLGKRLCAFLVAFPFMHSAARGQEGCNVELECGMVCEASIDDPMEMDVFRFSGEAGDLVRISVVDDVLLSLFVVWELRGPDGSIIRDQGTLPLTEVRGSRVAELATTGTYVLTVKDRGQDDTGAYAVSADWIQGSMSCLDGELQCDTVVEGTIDERGALDIYTFDGQAGDLLRIAVADEESRGFLSLWELRDPSGQIARGAFSTLLLNVRGARVVELTSTGTYSLLVMDLGQDGVGSYGVSAKWLQGAETCLEGELQCGVLRQGELVGLAKTDAYYFEADAGDVVDISVVDEGLPLLSTWELLGPDAVVVQAPDDAPLINVRGGRVAELSATGTYTLLVTDIGQNASGAYDVLLVFRLPEEKQCPVFIRGDCNGDGEVPGAVDDALFLLGFLFLGAERPSCLAACDVDRDGEVRATPTDAVYLLSFLFLGGPPPPPPYPVCGLSTRVSDKSLGCNEPLCRPQSGGL